MEQTITRPISAIITFAMLLLLLGGFRFAYDLPHSLALTTCSDVSATGQLGHWKLDENGGTTALDSSGNNRHGSHVNDPDYVAGNPAITPNPSALAFDGVDDYVNVSGTGGVFDLGTANFTVSTFIKTTEGDSSVLGNFSAAHRGWGLYLYDSNRVNFFGYGTLGINDASHAATVLDNGWHHVAGVYTRTGDNLNIDTYVDGNLVGSNSALVGDITSNSALLFGRYIDQPYYDGTLDDIRVYQRALTADEIEDLADGCGNPSTSSSSSSSSTSSSSSSSSSTSSSSSSSSSTTSSSSSSSSVNPAQTCDGKAATIYVKNGKIVGGPDNGDNYYGVLRGTNGDDVIVGTNDSDIIGAKNGKDTVCSRGGNDIAYGDNGKDSVFGGNGRNIILGGDGNDYLRVGNGRSILNGGNGKDDCDANNNNSLLVSCEL